MSLRAAPDSTVPLEYINYESDLGEGGNGDLICHVRGGAEDLDAAGVALTNSGTRNLQVLAVAANAAILQPHLEVVYEPRPTARFLVMRTLGSDPQAARRMIDIDRSMALIMALAKHPKESRLLRAAANYGESLRRSDVVSSAHAVLHLWMAVENLTEVVGHRLKEAAGAERISELGDTLCVKPRPGRDYVDDRDIQGELRRREVFDGDDATHRALRRASDGIEHGFLSFGEARELMDGLYDKAAAAVRRSILRESGLPQADIDVLTSGIFERPLPIWRPRVAVRGSFAADTSFNFERPIDLQVDADLRIEGIAAEQHATTAEVDVKVKTHDGLKHRTESIGLRAPGELRPPEDPSVADVNPAGDDNAGAETTEA